MDITEIQDELLRLEYPNLLPDHDPDIERYYYLRSISQSRDAMWIYQNRLVVRYPDDKFRTWLLRCYRSHDPAFRSLLARGYRMLGARSLERVKQVLLIIAEKAETFNEKDVYSTIKTAEEILKFLSPERYEAMAGMERFFRYASVLDLKIKSIARATELIRAYLTDTLSVVEEERRRRSEAQRKAEDKALQALVKADWDSYYYQKKYGTHLPLIDLSSVVFSADDLARIEIPYFSRVEDQILAYCVKYWNNVDDPAFERILFLYSRKYGKKNYEVYMAIRQGQKAKNRDDEILASIMSILVTGYYYSIQGDLYLQRNWNSLKRILANQQQKLPPNTETKQIQSKPVEKQIKAKPKTAPAKTKEQKKIQPKIAPKTKSRTVPKIAPKPEKVTRPAAVMARPAGSRPAPVKPVKVPYKLKPAQQTKTTMPAKTLKKIKPVQPAVQLAPRPAVLPIKPIKPVPVKPAIKPVSKPAAPRPLASAPPAKPAGYRPAPFVTPSPQRSKTKQKVFNNKTLSKAKGSVADRLRQLSGRSYDVYQDRFLAKARTSIRKVLGTGKGLFFTLPEEAEDLVYNFLRDHYSDPYMDWEDSADRKNLLTMGFDLSSIHPVIDECYKTL
ncbi:MAG: hypothetical protein FWG27_00640 [Treponema sp.]|nr:hypothetical protein [Treponema sp.]